MEKESSLQGWLKNIGADIASYFNVAEDMEPQNDIEQSIRAGVSFKGSQLLMLIFAIIIASLGLNTNSIPVIIGAMLISPLMGPIIGMGLAIGIQDFSLLQRGFKNIFMAVLGSLAASAVYFMISPQYGGSAQLLARTSPSIYDVFVALFGGAAGILSIACRNKGQVMPGVAIATSLMPPLCTAGYGIATLQAHFFLGALYLFFTNMIFILFAALIGVKLMKFKKVVYQNSRRNKMVQNLVLLVVVATIIVSAFLTYTMIKKNIFLTEASAFVEKEMVFPNTQVLNHKEYINNGKRYIDVTLIGNSLPKDSLQLAMMTKLDSVGLGGTVLNIKQGFSLDLHKLDEEENFDKYYSLTQQEISQRQVKIDSLERVIRMQTSFTGEGASLAPEIHVLFPAVSDIALARMVVAPVRGKENLSKGKQAVSATDTVKVVFVHAPSGLSVQERKKLKEYVGVRLREPDIELTVNPSNFPWTEKH